MNKFKLASDDEIAIEYKLKPQSSQSQSSQPPIVETFNWGMLNVHMQSCKQPIFPFRAPAIIKAYYGPTSWNLSSIPLTIPSSGSIVILTQSAYETKVRELLAGPYQPSNARSVVVGVGDGTDFAAILSATLIGGFNPRLMLEVGRPFSLSQLYNGEIVVGS